MDNDRLDNILADIYSDSIYPAEELVQRTKSSLRKPSLLHYILAFSIGLNLIAVFAFIYVMLLGLHSLLEKTALFIVFSIVQNAVILVAYLYKEDVSEILTKIQANLD
jgi:glucan phosphoethanolaminetransferase (alkaline phosphatase superfamily)